MKIKHFTVGLLALAIGWSCTDMTEDFYSTLEKEQIYESEQLLRSYAASAYIKLQAYGSEQSLWTLNIQSSDECAAPANALNDWVDPRYKELQTHNITPSNKLVRMGWEYWESGLSMCNDVIYEIGHAKVDFAGKQQLLAEVKVLRAFYYFCAIDGWGNVPYVVDAEDKSYPEQKGRDFMFPFIEKEILDNVEFLATENNQRTYGKVTQGVAYTLLAKMYLNAEEWIGTPMYDKAEEACVKVIELNQYVVEDVYKDNFKVDNEGSKENIFVIPYSTTYTTSDHNDFVVFILSLAPQHSQTFNIPTACWDGFICQPDFFVTYDDNDTRKADTWLYGQQFDISGAPIDGFILDPMVDESKYSTGKGANEGAKVWKWTYQTDGQLKSDQTSMDNDFALFRYADVLYMYAEALLRQGKDVSIASNRADFQKIRTRAGLAPFTAATLDLDALLLERGHELAWEGWRRQDLIRFGKYSDVWWAKPNESPAYAKLYPIPTEKMLANPKLKQNSGYPQ